MDMQQAYAGADLSRLEERLAEAEREIRRLRAALQSIINGYQWPKDLARRVLDGRPT